MVNPTQNNSKGIINIIIKYTINFLAHALHYVLDKDNSISIMENITFRNQTIYRHCNRF